MIFAAAPPARANTGSLDPATAIAVAPSARSSFREFFMSSSLGLKAGYSPEVNPSVLYSRLLPPARIYLRRSFRRRRTG
jgi:hypothetical protein